MLPQISNRTLYRAGECMTWALPPLVIPALRFMQDPVESRRRLFIRDFSTYSLGAGLYFAGKHVAYRLLRRWMANADRLQFVAFAVGLLASMLYAGIGAVRLAPIIDNALQKHWDKLPVEEPVPTRTLHPGPNGVFDVFQRRT